MYYNFWTVLGVSAHGVMRAVTLMALSMGATPDGKAHSMIQMSVNAACTATFCQKSIGVKK